MANLPTPKITESRSFGDKGPSRGRHIDYDMTLPDATGPRRIVRVNVYHHKERKAFTTSVNRMEADGIWERTAYSFRGPDVRLPSRPVARFSAKALDEYAEDTRQLFEQLVADDYPDAVAMIDNSDPEMWLI